MGSNRFDRNGTDYRMVHMGGGKGQPDPKRKKRKRVDGDRVCVEVDSTRSGKHNASGRLAFGCVIRDGGEAPWFFIDGEPTEASVTSLAIARMAWHLCQQCEDTGRDMLEPDGFCAWGEVRAGSSEVRAGTCKLDDFADVPFSVDYEIEGYDMNSGRDYATLAECSACGACIIVPPEYHHVLTFDGDEVYQPYRFCPNCGRKVRA